MWQARQFFQLPTRTWARWRGARAWPFAKCTTMSVSFSISFPRLRIRFTSRRNCPVWENFLIPSPSLPSTLYYTSKDIREHKLVPYPYEKTVSLPALYHLFQRIEGLDVFSGVTPLKRPSRQRVGNLDWERKAPAQANLVIEKPDRLGRSEAEFAQNAFSLLLGLRLYPRVHKGEFIHARTSSTSATYWQPLLGILRPRSSVSFSLRFLVFSRGYST